MASSADFGNSTLVRMVSAGAKSAQTAGPVEELYGLVRQRFNFAD